MGGPPLQVFQETVMKIRVSFTEEVCLTSHKSELCSH